MYFRFFTLNAYIGDLSMKEAEIYFKFLLHIASADGNADPGEIEFIEHCLASVGLSDVLEAEINAQIAQLKNHQAIEGLDDVLDAICTIHNPSFAMTLIRDGYAMATADGEVQEEELHLIRRLIHSLGNESQELVDEALDWARESLSLKIKGEELFTKLNGAVEQ